MVLELEPRMYNSGSRIHRLASTWEEASVCKTELRAGHTWMTFPYWMTVPSNLRFSDSFCFFSRSAACCRERGTQSTLSNQADISEAPSAHTWSLLRSTASVVLLPPGFAAFQNCFCAEYLFIGHSLKRQSKGNKTRGERQRVPSTPNTILTMVLHKLAHWQC